MGFVENVNTTATALSSINIANIATVAGSATNIKAVVTQVIPNLTEILLADDNAIIATQKAVLTAADAITTNSNAIAAAAQASIAVSAANSAQATSLIVNAYGNIQWAGFVLSDGELVVNYFSSAASTPSIVDGEFILTW